MSEDLKETAEAIESAAGVVERGVEAVAAQIAELAATYGEPAWNTVLLVTQIDAAKSLAPSLLLFSVGAYVLFNSMRAGGWFWDGLNQQAEANLEMRRAETYSEEWRRASSAEDRGVAQVIITSIAAVTSGIVGGIGLSTLLNIWKWVALFSPELYLAKRALDAVVSL